MTKKKVSTVISTVANAPDGVVPLHLLVKSPYNVGKTGREKGLEGLAENIFKRGIRTNLLVTEVNSEYLVHAGWRRWTALKLLLKQKRITKTYEVPVKFISLEEAREASLAENALRVNMHPADEFDGFAELVEDGMSYEDVAATFGVTPAVVARRMKLARVAPAIFQEYREDKINLEVVTAFTLTDDHERQLEVRRAAGSRPQAHLIKAMLTEGKIALTDRRVKFVGLDAYEAAGGTVLRSLFDETGSWVEDAALLDRLAMDRLNSIADPLIAEGWAWSEVCLSEPDEFWSQKRLYPQSIPFSEEDQKLHDELQQQMNELEEVLDEAPDSEEAEAELDKVKAEYNLLEDRTSFYTDETKARSGVMVFIGHAGLQIERGMLKRGEGDAARGSAGGAAVSGEGRRNGGFSSALTDELEQHRTAGLRVALMRSPNVAILALTHRMVKLVYGASYAAAAVKLSGSPDALRGAENSPALNEMKEAYAAWRKRLPLSDLADIESDDSDGSPDVDMEDDEETEANGQDSDRLWAWLVEQNATDVNALLAFCVGWLADAGRSSWGGATPLTAQIAQAAGLDMADFWQPDTPFFKRVPKAMIAAAVEEVKGTDEARRVEKMKKGDAAQAAEELLKGERWLPGLMRLPRPEAVQAPEAEPMGEAA